MSLVRRRLFSSMGFTKLSKGPRRRGAGAFALPNFGIERLEARLALASQPVLISPSPIEGNEGDEIQVSFQFTDAVSTGSGQLPGLDPFGYENELGDLDGVRPFDSTSVLYAGITSIVLNTGLAVPQMVVTYGGGLFTDTFYGAIEERDGPASTDRTPLDGNNFVVDTVEIAVFAFDSFKLGVDHIITAALGSSRPVAILSQSDLTIAGTIDVSANGTAAGPGGGAGGSLPNPLNGDAAAGAPVVSNALDPANPYGLGGAQHQGGGGGGFGGRGGGGTGGGGTLLVPNNSGGAGYGDLFDVIQGGSGGGAGRTLSTVINLRVAPGGGGGGGIELGADGKVEISGSILANGGAGQTNAQSQFVAGGGGAGGGILIHAEDVVIASSGQLSARGGAGGISSDPTSFNGGGGGGGGHIAIAYLDDYDNFAPASAMDVSGGANGSTVATQLSEAGEIRTDLIESASAPELYSFVIDWGDGSAEAEGSSNPGGGITVSAPVNGFATGIFSGSHTYADGNASYEITVTVTDDQGMVFDTFNVTVANVAPALVISGSGSQDEGEVYELTLSSNDPGSDTISSWTIDWGDGGAPETFVGNPTSVTHTYADGGATYTIAATATDEDGTHSAANTLDVVVENVVPTVVISGASSINEGSTYTLALASSDPGDDTIQSWTINWGDGNIQLIPGSSASVTHVYADGNSTSNYTILATATDEDGTFAANTLAVSVLNVDPTADAGGPYVTFDDLAITLAGTASDVAGAADPLSYAWDLDNDGVFETTTTDPTVSFNPEDFGIVSTQVWTVRFKVTDGDGGEAIDTATVQVYGKGTYLIDGILYVIGDKVANDIALISQCDGDISVLATFNGSNPAVFAASDVAKIVARTRGGHDVCVATPSVTKNMTIEGGDGNDLLVGGCGENFIYGGAGHDTLYGGCGDDMLFGGEGDDDLFGNAGDDVLIGGAGRDILNGGLGRDLIVGGMNEDLLHGGSDDDILIGGYTLYDENLTALDSIMAIWGDTEISYLDRVAILTSPTGWLRTTVGDATVFDDAATDHIIGAAGRDLAFADASKWDGVKDTISLSSAQDTLIAVNESNS